jgi:hypothetical protein
MLTSVDHIWDFDSDSHKTHNIFRHTLFYYDFVDYTIADYKKLIFKVSKCWMHHFQDKIS